MVYTKFSSIGLNPCEATYPASIRRRWPFLNATSLLQSISAFKRGLLPDGDLYKELTKYQCKTMEDVLSQAWAHVKWEEDVASGAKVQLKEDPNAARPDQNE